MAVELLMGNYGRTNNSSSFSSMKMDENSVEGAATAGLQSVEKLIRLLSQSQQKREEQSQSAAEMADVAVHKFKKVISLLDRTRTGHARFRRAPLQSVTDQPIVLGGSDADHHHQEKIQSGPSKNRIYCPTPIQRLPPLPPPPPPPQHQHQHQHQGHVQVVMAKNERKECSSTTISFTSSPAISAANSFMSSVTGDSDGKQPSSFSAFQITNLPQGLPPLSSSSALKRKCSSLDDAGAAKCGGGSAGRCHCSKRRKSRVKRVVRVPAISLKMADIPPDDYSWRKYGQKPIKGSPHPRGYYKCSSVRGCPARKHVERALDDPTMLIVTYDDEHNHSQSATEPVALILESS